jgi:hypothetical protein
VAEQKTGTQVACPKCNEPLPGVLVPAVLGADDIVEHFSGHIERRTVLDWFRTRVLSGFKPPRSRDWLITVDDYLADIERLKRSSHAPTAMKRRTLDRGGDS